MFSFHFRHCLEETTTTKRKIVKSQQVDFHAVLNSLKPTSALKVKNQFPSWFTQEVASIYVMFIQFVGNGLKNVQPSETLALLFINRHHFGISVRFLSEPIHRSGLKPYVVSLV